MFGYYFDLAFRSLKHNPVLTALIVLSIAFGVSAFMIAWSVFMAVAGDPIPWKSSRLFVPQIDVWGPTAQERPGEPQDALDYFDAIELMRDHRAYRQSAIYAVGPMVQPTDGTRTPIPVGGYAVYGEFFAMLDVPFQYGKGWVADAEERAAPVIVIGHDLNEKLFGGLDSTGRTVIVDGKPYRIVGVMREWNPQPVFFDVVDSGGFGGDGPDLFLPFERAIATGMPNAGDTDCRKGTSVEGGFTGLQRSTCVWIAFMAELDPSAVTGYRNYLDGYARTQQQLGRFQWAPNNRLRNVKTFLDYEGVVPPDTRVSLLAAAGLLIASLVNAIGLLLAKFLRRDGEIGIRRALGASRRAICAQFLVEAALIGILGAALALLFTGIGMLTVGSLLPIYLSRLAYADPMLLAATIAMALVATTFAAMYPAVRASRVVPSIRLKTQ